MTLDIGALYEAYKPALEHFVARRVAPQEVDDLVAETFAKAVRSSHQYRDMGYAPQSWLLGIATNLIMDLRRGYFAPTKGRINEALFSDHALGRMATVDAGSSRHVDGIDVRVALDALPSDLQRRTLALRYLDGSTIAETSATIGSSEEAVKKLAWRGLATMRRSLRETA